MAIDRPPCGEVCSLTVEYAEDGHVRRRTIGPRVQAGHVDLAPLPARLLADWRRETETVLALDAGDVESLPLARARARWPERRASIDAAIDWLARFGELTVNHGDPLALMACRGARYHHDAQRYPACAFFNVFLCEDLGLDLHFPHIDRRIPLRRGTVVLFDTGQPHAVVRRDASGFDPGEFDDGVDRLQCFLTWELPIERRALADALGVAFLADGLAGGELRAGTTGTAPDAPGQLRLGDDPVEVCAETGRWKVPVATRSA